MRRAASQHFLQFCFVPGIIDDSLIPVPVSAFTLLGSVVLAEIYKESVASHRYIAEKGRTYGAPKNLGDLCGLDDKLKAAGLIHRGQGMFGHEWNKPWLGSGRVRGLDYIFWLMWKQPPLCDASFHHPGGK